MRLHNILYKTAEGIPERTSYFACYVQQGIFFLEID